MTQPGIGAGGSMGLAIEVLPPPENLVATGSASGGSLADDDYFYVVTAFNSAGETTVSAEDDATVTGGSGSGSVALTWDAVLDARGQQPSYRVYRSTTTGSGYQLIGSAVTNSFDDDGSGSPTTSPPTANTALSYGLYTAPTKFFPFNSESLVFNQETVWRRPIRQSADVIGAVPGNVNIEGDLEMEALEDVVPYFILASRVDAVKSVSGSNISYTFTPTPAAIPVLSLSLTVVRNEEVFGYTGCVTSGFTFTVSDGLLMFNTSILGSDEVEGSNPTEVFTTTTPFGAGQYTIQIPTGTPVFDTDTFEFEVNDNGESQYRLKNTGRGAEFIKFGERECTISVERDFLNRDDYDAFKQLTAQAITITAVKSSTNYIDLVAPVAIKNTYEVGLSGQGDLVRASIEYQNVINASGHSYSVVVATQEDIPQVEESP